VEVAPLALVRNPMAVEPIPLAMVWFPIATA
jgi:hypothetical protein